MWQKIKKAFIIAGAVITVGLCTIYLVFLRRRDSDGRGSDGVNEYDSRVEEGLSGATERINECRGTAERCEERLRRAEEILRTAIERGEKEKH